MADKTTQFKFQVAKKKPAQQVVFGWASVAVDDDGNAIIDKQGDIIEPDELEKAVYDYVLTSRDGGEMHERGGTGTLIESIIMTPEKAQAMGIPDVKKVAWWVGYKIHDPEVWKKVESGDYSEFSIEGKAKRIETDAD